MLVRKGPFHDCDACHASLITAGFHSGRDPSPSQWPMAAGPLMRIPAAHRARRHGAQAIGCTDDRHRDGSFCAARPLRSPRGSACPWCAQRRHIFGAGARRPHRAELKRAGVHATIFERLRARRWARRCWTDAAHTPMGKSPRAAASCRRRTRDVRTLAQDFGLPLDDLPEAEPASGQSLAFFDGGAYAPPPTSTAISAQLLPPRLTAAARKRWATACGSPSTTRRRNASSTTEEQRPMDCVARRGRGAVALRAASRQCSAGVTGGDPTKSARSPWSVCLRDRPPTASRPTRIRISASISGAATTSS